MLKVDFPVWLAELREKTGLSAQLTPRSQVSLHWSKGMWGLSQLIVPLARLGRELRTFKGWLGERLLTGDFICCITVLGVVKYDRFFRPLYFWKWLGFCFQF